MRVPAENGDVLRRGLPAGGANGVLDLKAVCLPGAGAVYNHCGSI